jgi:hypothetical protein
MREGINKFTQNLLRQAALERVRQLEKLSENINVIKKQLDILDTVDELILFANTSSEGMVEFVITDKVFKEPTPVRILENSVCRISAFNINDPESKKVMMRTIIVIDPLWSNNFIIYKGQYGLPDSTLREYETRTAS